MNITELRSQATSSRASKESVEDREFNESPLRHHIDKLIKEAAKDGEYEISPNYYYTKECVLGERYGGPSIEAAIRHYSHEGFVARQKSWLSPNGYGNTSLIISWK